MNCKHNTIRIALLAALALAAIVPTAQAQFTVAPVFTLSGTQKETHSYSAGSGFGVITCSTSTLHGTASGPSDSLVMTPTYSGCKDSLGRTVDITNNTLSFNFTSGATVGETKGNVDLSGELVFSVTSGGGVVLCMVTIGAQTLSGVTYKNLGGTSGVEIIWNTSGFHSTVEGGFLNCGTATTSATAGTYKGTTIVTATQNGDPVGVNLD